MIHSNLQKKALFKKGDTLVEVMFSVAIFGLVSISSIAMMNKGVSTAQGTLETSMARQEIDTQAEAIRFIHNAYSMNASDTHNPYVRLWDKLTAKAIDQNHATEFLSNGNYNGQDCSIIYSNNKAINTNSFVINPRMLNNTELASLNLNNNSELQRVLVPFLTTPSNQLTPTMTYPRILYNNSDSQLSDATSDGSASYDQTLRRAEGIWVTAVQPNVSSPEEPVYYDFYIRTCWENISGNGSSTISTVIRLYNPKATVI